MAIFSRKTRAAIAIAPPHEIKAAVGYSSGKTGIGEFYSYTDGTARNTVQTVPVIARARDLIASVIGCLPVQFYRLEWDGEKEVPVNIPPRSWAHRIDPAVSNTHILTWTFDDLFHYSRAFWAITSRYSDGFPASFTRLPAYMVTSPQMAQANWPGPASELEFNGRPLNVRDVVQFLGTSNGIVYFGNRTISTAIKLEESAYKNASSSMPSGVLRQISGEPLSAEELLQMASAFQESRLQGNSVAALNEHVTYTETTATPDKLLLTESREFQANELARLCSIPAYLANIGVPGYTYQNAQRARQDLYVFAAKSYIEVINQVLSSDQVVPRGTYVRLDVADYLSETFVHNPMDNSEEMGYNEPEEMPPSAPENR